MQLTGAVPPGSRPQYLDKLQVSSAVRVDETGSTRVHTR
jgi:hypothetical protein